MSTKFYFDKVETNYIKGVLLVFMFILHFFCYPGYYIEGISYPDLAFMEKAIGHLQICVSGFAFLTGYFYYYTHNKTYKYSLKKILALYIPYWVVLIFLLLLAVITGTYAFSVLGFLLEILAIQRIVMCFCWYVLFYVMMMLALPITIRFFGKYKLVMFAVSFAVPMALYYGVAHFTSIEMIVSPLEKFQVYYPIAIVGYISAEIDLFQRIDVLVRNKKLRGLVSSVLAVVVFMEPTWLYSFGNDIVLLIFFRKIVRVCSIPLFVYGLINIFRVVKNRKFLIPIEMIGKYSMTMWFVHCIFFNCSKEVFQKILYWPHFPVLVVAWGLVLCLCASIPLQKLSTYINKIIKI